MTEIREEHLEWATVDRMRQMMSSVRRDYEITQTYTLFTGILCWTMQRIRAEATETETDKAMNALCSKLGGMEWKAFYSPPGKLKEVRKDDTRVVFNDFSGFCDEEDRPLKTMRVLKALRNAVAHGDDRRVRPFNRGGRLVGYEMDCHEDKYGRRIWEHTVVLDREAMSRIAGTLADRYCRSFPGYIAEEAGRIIERAA